MQLFADDLAWMCAQLGLEKPVVIGHSMGGVVALALRYPELPSAIVMIDAPVVRPAEGSAPCSASSSGYVGWTTRKRCTALSR
jgi:pimeloyl-ACP methyl ester carboxylesterase